MRIPSPDESLVHGFDRLLSLPQRRGTPLPRVLIPLLFLEPFGLLVTTASIVGSGAFQAGGSTTGIALLLAGMFGLNGAVDIVTGILKRRTLVRHAKAWSPELSANYRADALASREGFVLQRYIGLVFALSLTVMAAYFLVVAGPHRAALPYAFAGVGMALAWIGRQVTAYAECAMPYDPETTQAPAMLDATPVE